MTKKDKKRAFREAIKRAKETLAYYEKKSLEELEKMDTSELCCLGADFNWLPNSGYDYDKEQQQEDIKWLCECADHRAKREKKKREDKKAQKEHFYKVRFLYENGELWGTAKVSQIGEYDSQKILRAIFEKYPEAEDKKASMEEITRKEFYEGV